MTDRPAHISHAVPPSGGSAMLREGLLAGLLGISLTMLFFWPLWLGDGLIGGDLYTYYFPQKLLLQQALHRGELLLWNPLTGHGYPALAESQTGVLYPPNWFFYGCLELNTAYHASQLTHYVLAFVGAWALARRIGLSFGSAAIASLIFTYGWFPPRICLEWAIVTGMYLPWVLLCVVSFLDSGAWRYGITASLLLALQLFAGHFHLAFITLLLAVGYTVVWRLRGIGLPATANRRLLAIGFWLACGFGLAAAQLVPTWELKALSQRVRVGDRFDPAYGHIPPLYLSQLVAPWMWYRPGYDLDGALRDLKLLAVNAGTNKVEAHLYLGFSTFVLFVVALSQRLRRRSRSPIAAAPSKSAIATDSASRSVLACDPAPTGTLVVMSLLAISYAIGWWMPAARFLPGFSFFTGPGRYGIVVALLGGCLAGRAWESLTAGWRSPGLRFAATGTLFLVLAAEFWWVSQVVTYAWPVPPPLAQRRFSAVKPMLADHRGPVRLLAPGANACNVLEVAALPVYLGLGPDLYFREEYLPAYSAFLQGDTLSNDEVTARVTWLRAAGVTHLLTFVPLGERWPVVLRGQGIDPYLNRVYARYDAPVFLYRLDAPGRVYWDETHSADQITVLEHKPHTIRIRTNAASDGVLVLTDLMYPGWTARIDGQPTPAETAGSTDALPFRRVRVPSGEHVVTWEYAPASVRWGLCLSAAVALFLAAVAHMRFWHRTGCDRWLGQTQGAGL